MEDLDFLIYFTEHYDPARDYAWIECRPKSKEDANETFPPLIRFSRYARIFTRRRARP